MTPQDRIAQLVSQSEKMFGDKRPWDNMCQEVAEHFYPLRADFNQSLTLGAEYASYVMDSWTINSREELGNAIDSMLRRGNNWFNVGTGDADRDYELVNARALNRATMLLQSIIRDPRCNFHPATKESDQDYVAFGQCVLSIEENGERTFPRVRAWHPGACAWLNDDDGEICRMDRKFEMTCYEIMKMIKQGRWTGPMPVSVQTKHSMNPSEKCKVLHVFMEAEDLYGDSGTKMRAMGRNRWISLYIDVDSKEVMHERSEPMNPYITPKWRSMSGHTQGFSPAAMNSLPNSRMLQTLATILMEQGEKAVDPPMVGAGEVFTRDINMYAGGFTYVDLPDDRSLQDVMAPVNTSEGMKVGFEMQRDLRALITDSWLLNKLFLPQASDMREAEVMVRTEEFRRVALPFFSPIEYDYHPKLLGKIFERALIMGVIPPSMFPDTLRGHDVKFTFNSPLNEAEGRRLVESYNMAMNTIGSGAQVDQTIVHMFDFKRMAVDAVRGGGAPPEWVFSGREAQKRLDEANAAQQLQQAAQISNEGSLAISNLASAKQAAEGAGMIE